MTPSDVDRQRRRLLSLAAKYLSLVPFAAVLPGNAAGVADGISESDPAAAALQYKADATKAPARKDAAAFCENCALYSGKAGSSQGACAALGNRLVAVKGWCASWESY
jgi:High potential iron-sulfur protein